MSEQSIEEIKAELEATKAELKEIKAVIQILITMGNLHQWVIDKATQVYRSMNG